MNSAQLPPFPVTPESRASRVNTLALHLAFAEHNLRNFTAGEADAVVDPEGKIHLLHHAQEHLRENERRLHTILESAADAIMVVNRGAIIQSITRASHRVLGYRPEELVGESFFQFIHPEDVHQFYFAFMEVMEGFHEVATAQFAHLGRTGVYRSISATVGKLRDPASDGVVISLRPMTHS
jgi:PAS domain S-box-containing protein